MAAAAVLAALVLLPAPPLPWAWPALGAQPALAQESGFRVAPAFLRSDGENSAGLRLRYNRDNHTLPGPGRLPRARSLGLGVNLPLAIHPDRNPETLRAEVHAGFFISLYNPPSPPPNPEPGERYGAWNYGYLSASVRGSMEADQELDTTDLLAGVLVVYEHDQYQGLWFLPELRLAADRGWCRGCDRVGSVGTPGSGGSAGSTGSETGGFTRLDAQAAWFIPLDREWLPHPLRPLWLRPGVRGFSNRGMTPELAVLRPGSGVGGEVEVAYRVDDSPWLHELFVGWRGGELPLIRGSRRGWRVGAAVLF